MTNLYSDPINALFMLVASVNLLDCFTAVTGIAGSLLLALNGRLSPLGWPLFLCANFGMIAVLGSSSMPLLFEQICFTCTSLLGIWRSRLELKLLLTCAFHSIQQVPLRSTNR